MARSKEESIQLKKVNEELRPGSRVYYAMRDLYNITREALEPETLLVLPQPRRDQSAVSP